MTAINWNLLQTPDVGNAFMQGMERGRERARKARVESALSAFAQNPEDSGALNALLAADPQTGMKMREYQRNEQFRSALSDYAASRSGDQPVAAAQPQMPGIISGFGGGTFDMSGRQATSADADTVNGGLAPSGNENMSSRDRAFLRMWEADPVKAMEIDSKLRDQAVERLKVANDAYGFAIQNLANVTDEASYQQVRNGFIQQVAPLGIDIAGQIPDRYPGPEGVRSLLMRAVSAKDQLAALDRQDRTDAYIDNIAEDNERADRNTDSLIDSREASTAQGWQRVGIQREGMLRTDARGRRGQDIASTDRRRGQDMTDKRARDGVTGSGRKASASKGGAGPIATDGKGNKVQWNGKSWVPVR